MEELSCANCPFDIEQPNGKPFCIQDATCEISVNWLNEHEQKIYNQALEDFECFAQKWADRQVCIGRKVVKLVVDELIDSAKELKK